MEKIRLSRPMHDTRQRVGTGGGIPNHVASSARGSPEGRSEGSVVVTSATATQESSGSSPRRETLGGNRGSSRSARFGVALLRRAVAVRRTRARPRHVAAGIRARRRQAISSLPDVREERPSAAPAPPDRGALRGGRTAPTAGLSPQTAFYCFVPKLQITATNMLRKAGGVVESLSDHRQGCGRR